MRTVAVAALAVALAGCAPKEVVYAVQIISTSCDSSLDPMDGVQFIRVRVTGDGIEPLEATSLKDATDRTIRIPEIPAGANRVVEVRGYDNDPGAGGLVVSMGRSVPFTVPDVVPEELNGEPVRVNVFLRKVNAFTPPAAASTPQQCQRLRVARAGHTATLLKDGRVFLAGGFNFRSGGSEKQSLADTEVFNPSTGAFEQSTTLAISNGTIPLPKAYHTATRLPSGQVLLWGGETYSGASNVVSPNAVILIYDPDSDVVGAVRSRSNPPSINRSQHAAAIDQNGKVLIVGGQSRTSSGLVPTDAVEWFDPTTNEYKVVSGLMLPRLEPTVAALKGGEFIAVAGGSDGTSMKNEVVFFEYRAEAFAQRTLSNPPRLADPGRRAAGGAVVNGGEDLMLLGGQSDPDVAVVKPVASTEIVSTANALVTPGPTVGSRGNICGVTLAGDVVMAVGGRSAMTPGGPSKSESTVNLIKPSGNGAPVSIEGPPLAVPRFAHTCTLLEDGTVLVTGGVNEALNGAQEVLQDAWIYQPAPLD